MRSRTTKPQFAENLEIRIQEQRRTVTEAKKANDQAHKELDQFLRDASARRSVEDWSYGSANRSKELALSLDRDSRKRDLEVAQQKLQRLEKMAAIGWAGLGALAEVQAKAATIDATKTQLTEELVEAEEQVEDLNRQISEIELQSAMRAEFSQAPSEDNDLVALTVERDEAVKRAQSLRKRLLAYQSDNPGLGRQLGIVTPATELAKLTEEMWTEVEAVKAKAGEEARSAQTRFDELLSQLEDAARYLGNIKGQLMLMDEELAGAGFKATDGHLAVNLRLPNMDSLNIQLRTAFLDGPLNVNPSYSHRW